MIYNTESQKRKKLILITSLTGNLGLLGFYKYADFAITQFNIVGHYFDLQTQIPMLNLALPIAISFYTFHSITYTVGLYRRQFEPAKSFTEYAIFVAFFPQLVAGPILRAKDFLPQLREKITNFTAKSGLKLLTVESSNLKLGVTMMAFGFLKKMFFADNIAPIANDVFNNPIGASSFEIWLGILSFGFQIYGDFSGYSDIAIGAALIMGLKIPINFNKPYFATSPSDFWRRWHMSLSSWLRDYLYIPLGGNRKSKPRTYFNLFVVMFLGGLWHGAAWNFVIWGMLHGSYLAIHKFLTDRFNILKNNSFFNSKIGKILSILVTQYLVFLAWIPFRVQDVNSMFYSIGKYVMIDFHTHDVIQFVLWHRSSVIILALFIVLHYISFRKGNLIEQISKYNLKIWTILLLIISVSIVFFYNGNPEDFIYFRF